MPWSPQTCILSNNGHPSVKANLKAVQGDLFLLEKYVFFVSKQPVLIELVDVHQVVFSRLGQGASASRSFDLKITTKSGPEYAFSSIIKEEKNGVEAYLAERKVRVKNEKVPEEEIVMAGDDDDDDEEMASIASGSDVERAKAKKSAGADLDSEEEGGFRFLAPFITFHIILMISPQTKTSRLQVRTRAPLRNRTQTVLEARPPRTPVATGILPEVARKPSRSLERRKRKKLWMGKALLLRRPRRRKKLSRPRMTMPWTSMRVRVRSQDLSRNPSSRSQRLRLRMRRMDL